MGSHFPAPASAPPGALVQGDKPIIIVGNGPVGLHCLTELRRRELTRPVMIFGREESQPYNRVALSSLIQGEASYESLLTPVSTAPDTACHFGVEITRIDAEHKTVTDHLGNHYEYHQLILALGSRPHLPDTPGRGLTGVYTFRDLKDAQALMSRHARCRHCVVIGGGLLGIEAAKGMARYGTRVTLIHHAPYLMNRQLDQTASERLAKSLVNERLQIRVNTTVESIGGNSRVELIKLRGGEQLECDTVVYATGIRPNIELARAAGISVGTGIRIDDQLRTSRPDIFAIGECAEHRGQIYGLVGPGLEQAASLAQLLSTGEGDYTGSLLASSLKVTGVPVYSAGTVSEYNPGYIDCTLKHTTDRHYRALKLHRGRLLGVSGVGEWPGFQGIQALAAKQARIWPWQRWQFHLTGDIATPGGDGFDDAAIVCNCRQIPVADIRALVRQDLSVDDICARSGAAQVCGSCRPLVAKLAEQQPETGAIARLPLIAGMLSLVYLLLYLALPAFPVRHSIQDPQWLQLWTDATARQWTGYTLLGLMVLSLVVSASKRGPRGWARKFVLARNLHLVLTLSMATLLLVHTGLQDSANLNFYLFSTAVALIALGGLTSCLAAFEPANPSLRLKAWKRRLAMSHLIAAWPLPVLLGFHIITVYYF